MRPNYLQKPLDIQNLEEGLREYFRLMSENARQDCVAYPDPDTTSSSLSFELEMA